MSEQGGLSYLSILEFLLRSCSSLLPLDFLTELCSASEIHSTLDFSLLMALQMFCLPRKHQCTIEQGAG